MGIIGAVGGGDVSGSFLAFSWPPRSPPVPPHSRRGLLFLDESHTMASDTSSLVQPHTYKKREPADVPYQTGQLHPAIRVADLLQHITQMKCAEGYGFKEEYEVSTSAFLGAVAGTAPPTPAAGRRDPGGGGCCQKGTCGHLVVRLLTGKGTYMKWKKEDRFTVSLHPHKYATEQRLSGLCPHSWLHFLAFSIIKSDVKS